MNKVVFIDFSIFMHRGIYACRFSKDKKIQPTYLCMTMIFSCLMRVGISPDDIVIMACDSPLGSWRRDVDAAYKNNRKAKREAQTDLNWDELFYKFNKLTEQIDAATPFHFVEVDKLEADDIIAYGVKHFSDNECVIVSSDSDFEQLVAYPNVRIFSPITKKYKHIKSPYKIIAKKIKKESTDNLITPIITVEDYEKRNKIVNLIQLPVEVEEKVAEALSKINIKEYDENLLDNDTLIERFHKLFNSNKIVNYNAKPRAKRKKIKIGS